MIYVTGDTHIPIDIYKLKTSNFPKQKEMKKSDFVIICGDFGGIWNNSAEEIYWRKWLSNKNFTTLFVDGNHENHKMLNEKYETVAYFGGKVHKISESIFHLMRGEVFEIDNLKLFVMGGAASHDKEYRKIDKTWWAEEMPSDEEYQNAVNNLNKHNWTVDFILTHCCSDSIQDKIKTYYEHNKLTNFFENVIKSDCKYKKWFFGHYHKDGEIDEKHICIYDRVINIIE